MPGLDRNTYVSETATVAREAVFTGAKAAAAPRARARMIWRNMLYIKRVGVPSCLVGEDREAWDYNQEQSPAYTEKIRAAIFPAGAYFFLL